MEDIEIELIRIAGEITLKLKNGTEKEVESLLRLIRRYAGDEHGDRIERWVEAGMPGA